MSEEGRLRPLQMEGDLMIAVCGHLREISVPGLAGIEAQLLARLAGQQIPSTLDILGGEGLAVVPFDALTQREGQLSPFLVPRPARGQIRHDRAQAVLWNVLIEHDEIVEHAHHRPVDRDRRFLEKRHARRTVEMADFQNAALLLGRCCPYRQKQQRARYCECANVSLHFHLPPVRQSGFVKSAIVAPTPVVGSRVRGNVPKVSIYRIGGIAAVLAPSWAILMHCNIKISPYFKLIENSMLRCNITAVRSPQPREMERCVTGKSNAIRPSRKASSRRARWQCRPIATPKETFLAAGSCR